MKPVLPTTCDALYFIRGIEILSVSKVPRQCPLALLEEIQLRKSESLRSQQDKCSGSYEQSSGVGQSLAGCGRSLVRGQARRL
jgi:hypothetical protein